MKSHEPTKERLLAEIAERMRVEEKLRAANRTLRTINRCNEALVRATEEIELVEAICRILVEDGGMRMAWVGYREEEPALKIRPIAHAGFDDGYLDRIDVGWGETPTGRGPTGVAVRTGELCWTDDIATDPHFRHWRDKALSRGYGSSLALPLKSDEIAFGAITLYADRSHAFDEQAHACASDRVCVTFRARFSLVGCFGIIWSALLQSSGEGRTKAPEWFGEPVTPLRVRSAR